MEERSVRVGMIFSSILRIKIIFFLFIRFKLFMSPLLLIVIFLFHVPVEIVILVDSSGDDTLVRRRSSLSS